MSVLVYGATGYTGRLIARRAAAHGIRPVLAGRDATAVTQLARELGYESRVFALDDPHALDRALAGVRVVLHCAGPFVHTSQPMADACIRKRVHYVDITGEIEVFEALHARSAEARAANVMLLPGAGFDVVPSDCLAAHLKARLPSATQLMLAIRGSGRLSRGTATTMVEHVDRGGVVRRNGRLTSVPPGWRTRTVDYGNGGEKAITIPWGDVATSYYSTGIPNVEVYAAAPASLRMAMKLSRFAKPLLKRDWVKQRMKARIRAAPAGPAEHELMHGSSVVWGRVEDPEGKWAESRITGPNGYLLTALSALLIVQRILSGQFKAGFMTPSLMFGPDLVLGIAGVSREDAG